MHKTVFRWLALAVGVLAALGVIGLPLILALTVDGLYAFLYLLYPVAVVLISFGLFGGTDGGDDFEDY